jgi:arginase family enzyme
MRTTAVVFPFDLFGNAGTGAGARLLGDALREVLADNRRETRPTRCDAYRGRVRIKELAFDTPAAVADWRKLGRQAVRQPLKAGDFTLWFAGNHLGVLPVYEELGADDLVVQFDAHLDVYRLHDVADTPANGNFLLHADGPLPRVVNVGHRDLFLPDGEVRETFAAAFPAEALAADLPRVAAAVREWASAADRVWIDLDADAFDPAFAPGVHHPLPFGLTPPQFLAVLDAAWAGKVVGLSVSEFDPGRDVRDTTLNLFGWLVERMLLRWYKA